MALTLMMITKDPEVARVCDSVGVDWVFVDLEVIGKQERQGHLDTVKSQHTVEDVRAIRQVLKNAKLLVRTNPIHADSASEIEAVVEAGADILMLPYFMNAYEVEQFVELVGQRAQTCLLLETRQAVERVDEILAVPGIDLVHIGLNDLHLSMTKSFMFELLTDGTIEHLAGKLTARGIPYGFGGLARVGAGLLPAELIIPEHYRLGSTMAILSRSFFDHADLSDVSSLAERMDRELDRLRTIESDVSSWSIDQLERNASEVAAVVESIVERKARLRSPNAQCEGSVN